MLFEVGKNMAEKMGEEDNLPYLLDFVGQLANGLHMKIEAMASKTQERKLWRYLTQAWPPLQKASRILAAQRWLPNRSLKEIENYTAKNLAGDLLAHALHNAVLPDFLNELADACGGVLGTHFKTAATHLRQAQKTHEKKNKMKRKGLRLEII
jgi:hypothetical protein